MVQVHLHFTSSERCTLLHEAVNLMIKLSVSCYQVGYQFDHCLSLHHCVVTGFVANCILGEGVNDNSDC